MSKRNLPFPRNGASNTVEHRALSDQERLLIERFLSSQDAVVAQANAAAEQFIRAMLLHGEMNPEDGWKFNRDKMRWEKHPVPVNA